MHDGMILTAKKKKKKRKSGGGSIFISPEYRRNVRVVETATTGRAAVAAR